MSLRTKILYILVAVVTLYAAVDNGILRFVAAHLFERLEEQEADQDMQSVLASVEAELTNLEESARIWGSMDQTLRFATLMSAPERAEFIAAELGARALGAADVDLLYFCSEDGSVLWSLVLDPTTRAPLKLTETLPSQRLINSPLLLVPTGQDSIRGLMTTKEAGPILISSVPILGHDGDGLSAEDGSAFRRFRNGNVILGRFIDAELRAEMGTASNCELKVFSPGNEQRAGERGGLLDGLTSMEFETASLVGEDDNLHVFASLLDLRTRTPLVLEAIMDRKFTRLGKRAVDYALLSTIGSILLILFVLLRLLSRFVLSPLGTLTHKALEIGRTDNPTIRVGMQRSDEIGQLANEFDSMLEKLADSRAQVVKTARKAGMSEIATGVLHNVGNVLNSVNVSASLVSKKAKSMSVGDLQGLVQVLDEHGDNLADFIGSDPRGEHLLPFLKEVAEGLGAQQASMLEELGTLTSGIDHIADLVRAQQSFAGAKGVLEYADLAEEVEHALHICQQSIGFTDSVEIVREFETLGSLQVDKHKLMEILVNLIQNAHQALGESNQEHKRICLRILSVEAQMARVEVEDNGMGILPKNLVSVFNHGFTTKADGHGFGLHVSANAATEMNASLQVRSAGPDLGATFFLDIPTASKEFLGAA